MNKLIVHVGKEDFEDIKRVALGKELTSLCVWNTIDKHHHPIKLQITVLNKEPFLYNIKIKLIKIWKIIIS